MECHDQCSVGDQTLGESAVTVLRLAVWEGVFHAMTSALWAIRPWVGGGLECESLGSQFHEGIAMAALRYGECSCRAGMSTSAQRNSVQHMPSRALVAEASKGV